MTDQDSLRPPLPPFIAETAAAKVRAAEDAWNGRDPAKVAAAYTPDTLWRNRSAFLSGRAEVEAFLIRKWRDERDYRLIKELWAFTGNRIAVRFAYEARDPSGAWFRAYGNENWEFAPDGRMAVRRASINDVRTPNRSVSSTGHRACGLRIILACLTSACKQSRPSSSTSCGAHKSFHKQGAIFTFPPSLCGQRVTIAS